MITKEILLEVAEKLPASPAMVKSIYRFKTDQGSGKGRLRRRPGVVIRESGTSRVVRDAVD